MVAIYLISGIESDTFFLAAGVIVLIMFVSVIVDVFRVRAHVSGQQGNLISMQWAPFGPGWFVFGRKNSNLYKIEYVDRLGNSMVKHVRVSLFYGVEVTD
jgi:hypothetical protein